MLIINAKRREDEAAWMHTSSLMALYANSKSSKGKRFSPEDFNPYLIQEKEARKPRTKKDVDQLIDKMKSFNG